MRFNDIPSEIHVVRMVGVFGQSAISQAIAVRGFYPSKRKSGVYEIFTSDGIVYGEPVDKPAALRMDVEYAKNSTYLAQLDNPGADGSFELQVAFFYGTCDNWGDVEIGVNENVEARYRRMVNSRREFSLEELCSRLRDDYRLVHDGKSYFFFSAGWIVENDRQTRLKEGNQAFEGTEINRFNSLQIASADSLFVATEKADDGIWVAEKLHERRGSFSKSIRLAEGELRFVDWTKATRIKQGARRALAGITEDNSSYLKKWDEYGNVEGELLLESARAVGVLYYEGAVQIKAPHDDKPRVSVIIRKATESGFRALAESRVEEVETVSDIPSYLSDPGMRFEQFSAMITAQESNDAAPGDAAVKTEAEDEAQHEPEGEAQQSKANPIDEDNSYFKVDTYDPPSGTLVLFAERIDPNGMLVMSLKGLTAQIRRREASRRRILDCEAAMPQLGLLLEKGVSVETSPLPEERPALNAYVREKLFSKNPPTPKQEEAIRIALNTPDIALIQGPPGTGKTTVITAIVERLNQMCYERGQVAKGQFLLTGFQHDAVENMIDRMSLNGIPVPKYGNRSGADDSQANTYERNLDEWCEDMARRIRAKNPKLESASILTEIEMLVSQYASQPTQRLAITLASKIADAPYDIAGSSVKKEARKLLEDLERANKSEGENSRRLVAARRLRVKKTSFLDDGPERAEDALFELEDWPGLDRKEKRLLEDAGGWDTARGVPPFLKDLKDLKEKLFIELSAPPEFHIEKANRRVLELVDHYLKHARGLRVSSEDMKLAALSDFVAELENDHYGMLDAVSEYSIAFAATCQQCAGARVRRVKDLDGSGSLEYQYVIVDEAARVSPRDLMIPMAQGAHVILVGDHRQLPHMIDEEVAKKMEGEEADGSDSDWLKHSMFEYLFTERIPELQANDHIQRCVSLDTQFRMHPMLGDFISHNFYERFDASEAIKSGLKAEAFAHNLPGTYNSPAIWIDVPGSLGRDEKSGTSKKREAEARAITKYLAEWMSSENGKELSYGVISFYSGQVDCINEMLGDLADGSSEVRVGTVDSFQGMEFDVVFLSMVRTLPPSNNVIDVAFSEDGVIRGEKTVNGATKSSDASNDMRRSTGWLRKRLANLAGAVEDAPESEEAVPEIDFDTPYRHVPHIEPSGNDVEAKKAQSLFGFLCMYNRLNVSMSRQKKLLVVVGDSDLLKTELSGKYIPGLVDFYALCCEKGVVIPWR